MILNDLLKLQMLFNLKKRGGLKYVFLKKNNSFPIESH